MQHSTVRLIGASFAGVLVGVAATVTVASLDLPESGNLAEWVGGLATAAALLAAVLAIQQESNHRREADSRRRRSRAEGILFQRAQENYVSDAIVTVTNHGSAPASAVRIYAWRDDGFDDGASGDPPGSRSQWSPLDLGTAPPNGGVLADEMLVCSTYEFEDVRLAAVFSTDDGGLWRRWEDGLLEDLLELDQTPDERTVQPRLPTCPNPSDLYSRETHVALQHRKIFGPRAGPL